MRCGPPISWAMPSENSIWAVAFLVVGIGPAGLPEFNGPVRVALAIAISGIARLSGVSHDRRRPDVPGPMQGWPCRWQQAFCGLSKGLRDVSTRWVVTHDCSRKGEIAWIVALISVRRSGLASRCAFSTRSRIISRAIVPKRRSQASRRIVPQWLASSPQGSASARCEAGLLQRPALVRLRGGKLTAQPTPFSGLESLEISKSACSNF